MLHSAPKRISKATGTDATLTGHTHPQPRDNAWGRSVVVTNPDPHPSVWERDAQRGEHAQRGLAQRPPGARARGTTRRIVRDA